MIHIDVESYDTVIDEILPIFTDHFEETDTYGGKVLLAPLVSAYKVLDDEGVLSVITARDDGVIVGYYISVVSPHMHYGNDLFSINDTFYLKPEYRHGKLASALLSYAEEVLKAMGASVMILSMKVDYPYESLCDYQGFKKIEYNYAKYIGE